MPDHEPSTALDSDTPTPDPAVAPAPDTVPLDEEEAPAALDDAEAPVALDEEEAPVPQANPVVEALRQARSQAGGSPRPAAPVPAAVDAPPPASPPPPPPPDPIPVTFDAVLAALDAPHRACIEQHVADLTQALAQERATITRLEADGRRASDAADTVATVRTELATAQRDAATAAARAQFYEAAISEGVKRNTARLAFLAASDEGYIAPDGTVRWAELRERFADLFEHAPAPTPPRPTPRGSAGAGLGNTGPRPRNLNQIIRDAAGRRTS